MHQQERDLIVDIFNRLSGTAGMPKDPEASALIQERARVLPDALYGLVQAVALQDVALRQAQSRIAELERQAAGAQVPSSGGFLGGSANPWGGVPRTSVPVVPPQPMYAPQPQPAYQPVPQPQAMPWGQGAGGGFLRGVAGTALGVAGGALLAEGVSNLFSGHGGGFGSGALAAQPQVSENVTVNNYYEGDARQDVSAQDSSGQNVSADAGWQDDGFDGGTGGDGSVGF